MSTVEEKLGAYDRLEKAHKRYCDAKIALIDAKVALEEKKGEAFLRGWVQGSNDTKREAWFREACPSYYTDLLLAEREMEYAKSELAIAKLRVEEYILMVSPSSVNTWRGNSLDIEEP